MPVGDVRYAQNAGINIAYQVMGDGPRDLIFACGTMSHLELWWGDPSATRMLENLAAFSRLILFDKPGTGLSDPIPAAPTPEQRTSDVVAVLDAVGSERAVVIGYSEGGFPAMRLAAIHPERVEALVLLSTMVATEWTPDLDVAREQFDVIWNVLDAACENWGQGILMSAMAPSWVEHPAYRYLLGSIERTCMSPGMARSVLQGMHDIDLRSVVPAIRVPTLVLHPPETMVPQGLGRDLARRIDGATFAALDGPDHAIWIHNAEKFPALVERFVTGEQRGPRDADRVLTTIVFTDIVDSTRHLADGGDAQWRATLVEHDRRMDELLARYEGEPVKHTGDGRMARFTRPARAIRFAVAMTEAARGLGLEIRVGIHTGECEVVERDLYGLAVNIAARVAHRAGAGEVLVSSTVRDLVIGSGLAFCSVGEHELKGAPGRWTLYRCGGDGPAVSTAAGVGYDVDARHPGIEGDALEPRRRALDRAMLTAARHAPGTSRRVIRVADAIAARRRARHAR